MNNDRNFREYAHGSGQSGGQPVLRLHRTTGEGEQPAPGARHSKMELGPRTPRSSLASVQLVRARTREEMQRLAEEAWRQRGLALIDPLLVSDDFARQALINEANRLYGRRQAAEGEVQP